MIRSCRDTFGHVEYKIFGKSKISHFCGKSTEFENFPESQISLQLVTSGSSAEPSIENVSRPQCGVLSYTTKVMSTTISAEPNACDRPDNLLPVAVFKQDSDNRNTFFVEQITKLFKLS